MSEWKPIETAPDDCQPVLVFAPRANKGRPSCEVVVIYRNDDGTLDFWTNGGANAERSEAEHSNIALEIQGLILYN